MNCGIVDNRLRLALAMIVVSVMAGGYCPITEIKNNEVSYNV